MSRFISLTLRRASVTLLIAFALVAAGVYAAFNINQELTPDLEFPIVTVITAMPGAAAGDIEEQVTMPLEATLSNVSGIAPAEHGFGADQLDYGGAVGLWRGHGAG